MSKVKDLREWHEQATPEQRNQLVELLGGPTVRVSLYQLRTDSSKRYHREASAARAGKIEEAIANIAKGDNTVPILTRGDICSACHSCHYWRDKNG